MTGAVVGWLGQEIEFTGVVANVDWGIASTALERRIGMGEMRNRQ